MRKFVLLLPLFLFIQLVFPQELENRKETAFKPGEELKYRLRYGFITAAEATLNVLDSDVKFDNKPVFHLVAQGKTAASFNLFYKVRNRYDSYIDRKDLTPYLYTENIREANYRRTDKVRFYQDQNKVVGNKGTFKGRDKTFDLVSAFFFARSLDLSGVRPGTLFTIPYFLDDEVADMKITYVGKETIKTPIGTFNCLKFNPSIKPGRIFRKDSKLYLWITDDGNRIPVKAQVEILVGSVTLEVTSAKGLKY
ncbi:DUF3108 domain-containing protein [Pararcticibacter amylolyticus]|uniref:DUF3108 domain-containing protein n=1 Tax=Pararcticibacter amylolyticus TaxID=2173175 RepID=UPI00192E3037|nr:DUF3108 domain-containing protein [Pararcticibacter amylolyticus]